MAASLSGRAEAGSETAAGVCVVPRAVTMERMVTRKERRASGGGGFLLQLSEPGRLGRRQVGAGGRVDALGAAECASLPAPRGGAPSGITRTWTVLYEPAPAPLSRIDNFVQGTRVNEGERVLMQNRIGQIIYAQS